MTEQPIYEFSKYLQDGDFDQASKEHGKLHARVIDSIQAAKDRIDLLRATGAPLRDIEQAENDLLELRRTFTLLNDDYKHETKQAAVKALETAAEDLELLRMNVRVLDELLIKTLDEAYSILTRRMAAEVKRNKYQQRLAGFSVEYGSSPIFGGRGVLTSWGQGLPVSNGELVRAAWRAYTQRYAETLTPDLTDFNRKGG